MLLLLVSAILTGIAAAQGYEIKVKIHNIPGDTVILGHHFSVQNRLIPDDTVVLDNKCEGVFRGKEKLPVGMYFLFLPSRNYFDILMDDNQHFTIENDTTDFLKNMKITGSIENQRFRDYQMMLNESQKEYRTLNEQYESIKGNEAKENEIADPEDQLIQDFIITSDYEIRLTDWNGKLKAEIQKVYHIDPSRHFSEDDEIDYDNEKPLY